MVPRKESLILKLSTMSSNSNAFESSQISFERNFAKQSIINKQCVFAYSFNSNKGQ